MILTFFDKSSSSLQLVSQNPFFALMQKVYRKEKQAKVEASEAMKTQWVIQSKLSSILRK